jgi:hypothetical protein
MLFRAQTVATRICSSFSNAAVPPPDRQRILLETAEDTEESICPLITRMGTDGLIPIASSLYALHEGRQVREEGIEVVSFFALFATLV